MFAAGEIIFKNVLYQNIHNSLNRGCISEINILSCSSACTEYNLWTKDHVKIVAGSICREKGNPTPIPCLVPSSHSSLLSFQVSNASYVHSFQSPPWLTILKCCCILSVLITVEVIAVVSSWFLYYLFWFVAVKYAFLGFLCPPGGCHSGGCDMANRTVGLLVCSSPSRLLQSAI